MSAESDQGPTRTSADRIYTLKYTYGVSTQFLYSKEYTTTALEMSAESDQGPTRTSADRIYTLKYTCGVSTQFLYSKEYTTTALKCNNDNLCYNC
jgi:hypothetical protein